MCDATWTRQHDEPSLLKGAAAGLLGGLAASWVMTQFQTHVPPDLFAKLLGEQQEDAGNDSDESQEEPSEPTTVQAASAISEGVFGHELSQQEKKVAGPGVHYALGTSAGVLYGALAEVAPVITTGSGLGFGTVFWLAADETAVPAVGLSGPPWEQSPSVHLYAFASHLVYGLATDLVRRAVRAAL